MSIAEYLEEMRNIQMNFLEFIEDDENLEENFQNLCMKFENQKIKDNKHDLRLFLHHVASVCANHHRNQNFFGKIEHVLQIFKNEIKKYYINSEIFDIFRSDKRILQFLIEEGMIIFDEYVARTIIEPKYVKKKYPQYFAPEIKTFAKEKWFLNENGLAEEITKELPENFYELRKIGENENYICELIRDDNAKDFVVYVSQNNFPIKRRIKLSIYETNSFLIKKMNDTNNDDISLIEYAAFFGAIQIFNYLKREGIEITPSLWPYVIHSQSAELIHLLEDCNVEPTTIVPKDNQKVEEKSFKGCFIESIKCNHNAIADYILNNFLQNDDQMSNDTFIESSKYYNFAFLQREHVNESLFYLFCKHDYYLFVDDLLKNKDININRKIIQNHHLQ